MQLFPQDKKNPKAFREFSYPTYRDIRLQNTVFSDVLAHNRFTPEEETPGRGTAVAIVSYNYWLKQGRNPSLVGSEIIINGRPFNIIGIMPEGFTGTMHIFSAEVWLPLGVYDQVVNDFQTESHSSLGGRSGAQLLLVGRLKPDVTATSAEAPLNTLATNLERAFPVEQKDQTFILAPLSRFATSSSPSGDGELKKLAPLLFGMAGVVLLVACLNLANMLLARGSARRKEIAIRLALGGSRGRIVRQLLTEGLMLAIMALDPVAFTVAPAVLAAAALIATWLPARRAMCISPMAALRTD